MIRGRRRRGRLVALAAAAVLLAALLAGYRALGERAAASRLRALRNAGWPTTPAELAAAYPPPARGPNAALLYLEAFDRTKEGEDDEFLDIYSDLPIVGEGYLPQQGEPLADAAKEAIRVYLAANRSALRLLHEAAMVHPARYLLDPGDGLVEVDYILGSRKAGYLLQLEGMYHSDAGEVEEAVESVVACLALGRSLRSEPFVLPQLVGVAIDSFSIRTAEGIVSQLRLADAQLLELDGALAECEDRDAWRRALIGERALLSQTFQALDAEYFAAMRHPLGVPGLFFLYEASGAKTRDFLECLGILERSIAICELPEPRRLPAWRRLKEGPAETKLEAFLLPHSTMASSTACGPLSGLTAAAATRTARAALAAERFRLARGRLPEALEELVPAYLETMPADPFAAAPLGYAFRERGFLVYSVGMDARDDGGAAEPEDIAFTVRR